jgi:hypothetical protein
MNRERVNYSISICLYRNNISHLHINGERFELAGTKAHCQSTAIMLKQHGLRARQNNSNVRNSMLRRGRAPGGEVGSSKAV